MQTLGLGIFFLELKNKTTPTRILTTILAGYGSQVI